MSKKLQLSEMLSGINEICNVECDITQLREISYNEYNLLSWLSRWSCCLWMLKANGKEDQYSELKRRLAEKLSRAYIGCQDGLKRIDQYLSEVKEAFESLRYTVLNIWLKFTSRTIVGVGQGLGRIAFEVGLSFDPILNVPFIPGSEIKGAVRHGWETVVGDSDLEHVIFGPKSREEGKESYEERKGREYAPGALFLDFYPIEVRNRWGRLLVPDVIAPHYPDDELDERKASPNPVVHISIADGVVFRGLIAITPFLELEAKRACGRDYSAKDAARDLAKSLILVGNLGLGARTSVGYGRFEVIRIEW